MKRRGFLLAGVVAPFFAIITGKRKPKPPMPPAKRELIRLRDGTTFAGPFTPGEREYIAGIDRSENPWWRST